MTFIRFGNLFSLPFSFFLFFIVSGTVAGCAAHMLSSWAAQSAGKEPTTWFLGGVNTQFSPSRKSLPASAAVRRSGTRRSGDVQPRSVLSEAPDGRLFQTRVWPSGRISVGSPRGSESGPYVEEHGPAGGQGVGRGGRSQRGGGWTSGSF